MDDNGAGAAIAAIRGSRAGRGKHNSAKKEAESSAEETEREELPVARINKGEGLRKHWVGSLDWHDTWFGTRRSGVQIPPRPPLFNVM